MPDNTQTQIKEISQATTWIGNAILQTRQNVEKAIREFVKASNEFQRAPNDGNKLALQHSIESFEYAIKAHLEEIDAAHLELKKIVTQALA